MPLKVVRSPRAKRDAFDIWDYVSADSPRGAERQLRRINTVVAMLAERPEAGRGREDLGADIRSFPCLSYIVFYRHSRTTLTIIRILHAARDISAQTLSDD